jgi:hypothetical protein
MIRVLYRLAAFFNALDAVMGGQVPVGACGKD